MLSCYQWVKKWSCRAKWPGDFGFSTVFFSYQQLKILICKARPSRTTFWASVDKWWRNMVATLQVNPLFDGNINVNYWVTVLLHVFIYLLTAWQKMALDRPRWNRMWLGKPLVQIAALFTEIIPLSVACIKKIVPEGSGRKSKMPPSDLLFSNYPSPRRMMDDGFILKLNHFLFFCPLDFILWGHYISSPHIFYW